MTFVSALGSSLAGLRRAFTRKPPRALPQGAGQFDLVAAPVDLFDLDDVERFLPDILGRALARAWVDRAFAQTLLGDPVAVLMRHGVRLPPDIFIETEMGQNGRQRIVVYQHITAAQPRRLLYLQLVMMAGK